MRGWLGTGAVVLLAAPGCADGAVRVDECVEEPIARPPGSPLWRVELAPVSEGATLDASGGTPHVAWDGAGWIVAWSDRLAVLDRAGATLSLEERGDGLAAAALEAGS